MRNYKKSLELLHEALWIMAVRKVWGNAEAETLKRFLRERDEAKRELWKIKHKQSPP